MLDVTADIGEIGPNRPDCTCDKGKRGRLLPNEPNPCEWHFKFELLAETKHSNRIQALDIDLDGVWIPKEAREGNARLALGSCRFFTSSFPQLATLVWKNKLVKYANHLFSTSPFTPTLRSLTYVGSWNNLTTPINNLTSFAYEGNLKPDATNLEDVRLFLLNNLSLESLYLYSIKFEGDSIGPPAHLSNLKSLRLDLVDSTLSAIIQVPPLQHLSSLRIRSDEFQYHTLYATGDGITFSARHHLSELTETWEAFTRRARPTSRHIHLDENEAGDGFHGDYDDLTFFLLSPDAHTPEIGCGLFPFWYAGFWTT